MKTCKLKKTFILFGILFVFACILFHAVFFLQTNNSNVFASQTGSITLYTSQNSAQNTFQNTYPTSTQNSSQSISQNLPQNSSQNAIQTQSEKTSQIASSLSVINPFTSEVVTDENITMTMTVTGRTVTNVPYEIKSVTNSLNQEITFLCFNWRDIETLNFNFTPNEAIETTSHQFYVKYLQSETLDTAIASGKKFDLYSGGVLSRLDFFYDVDSTATNHTNANSSTGQDFGLYCFEFSYSHLVDNNIKSSYINLNVAVLPDDINSIEIPADLLRYTVTSANSLLNQFDFSLATSALNYVNPARLQWEVVGVSRDNLNYCLDKAMQERYDFEYDSFHLVYPSNSYKSTGTTFSFDSNNIEGIWTVRLLIDTNQTLPVYEVENLSTMKQAKKSYLWLILLLVLLLLVIIATVITILVIIKKRKEESHVW